MAAMARMTSGAAMRKTTNRVAGWFGCSCAVVCLSLAFAGGFSTSALADETADLKKRVQQLEEQMVDMQVVIGTLQSMNAGPAQGPSASYGPQGGSVGYGGGDGARRSPAAAGTAAMEPLWQPRPRTHRTTCGRHVAPQRCPHH